MIETERLILRRFTPDDFESFAEIRADPDVARYIGGERGQQRDYVAARFAFYLSCYETHGYGASAILRKSDELMIGCGGLQPLEDTGETEIGYSFAKAFWGQGFATETAQAWFRYGFESAGLERIVAVAVPENAASWRVMEKLGMHYEGRAQHYGTECVKYAIAREQFRPADALYILHDEKRDEE